MRPAPQMCGRSCRECEEPHTAGFTRIQHWSLVQTTSMVRGRQNLVCLAEVLHFPRGGTGAVRGARSGTWSGDSSLG